MSYIINEEYFQFEAKNIKIEYIKEAILSSYYNLPWIFWEKDRFKNIKSVNNTVLIELNEWLPFHSMLLNMISGDEKLIKKFNNLLGKRLREYDELISYITLEYEKNKSINKNKLRKAFKLYSEAQGYAFFNLILPKKYINKLLTKDNPNLGIDNFIISLIEPHRNLYRRRELELCKKYNTEGLSDLDIEEYKKNEFLYSKYIEWNFYNPIYEKNEIIYKRFNSILNEFSIEDINFEMKFLKESREKQLSKIYNVLKSEHEKYLNGDDVKKYYIIIFLLNLATEEEYRHMIDTKFMYFLGKVAYENEIDISRTKTDKFISMLCY